MASSKKPVPPIESEKQVRPIDRIVPGVGRITVRTSRLREKTRDDLDRAITRAVELGELNALQLLKDRAIEPLEFLMAVRQGKVASVKPEEFLAPLVASWLDTGGLKKGSVVRYRQSWRFLYASLPSDPTLNDLTTRWWAQFVSDRTKEVGHATINRDRAALFAFRNWAKDHDYSLPELKSKKMKESPKRSDILRPGQLAKIEAHSTDRQWPFFWTLLETGARQGEVLNLTGPDIDRNRPAIRFSPQEGSKGKKERFVPVSDALHNWLLTQAAVAGNGRLFPYGRRTVQEWWVDVCEEAGIEGVTLHGLRATFITRALDAGVSHVQVQKLVGHSTLSMTERYYRNPKESLEAADQIREAIGFASERIPAEPVEALERAIPATPSERKR